MKPFIRTSILSALLVLAVAVPAAALAGDDNHGVSGGSHNRGGGKGHSVPEFDITAVGAIAALIAGGGIVLARRRKT
jgi:LPXTG-motif cell wall-anchored protein